MRLSSWLDEIAREDALSKNTMKHVKHFLSGVFRHAMKLEYIDKQNPVRECTIPDAREGGENLRLFAR
jgi:hypothetical protein